MSLFEISGVQNNQINSRHFALCTVQCIYVNECSMLYKTKRIIDNKHLLYHINRCLLDEMYLKNMGDGEWSRGVNCAFHRRCK